MSRNFNYRLNQFLGWNTESNFQNRLAVGESPDMTNFCIDSDYSLRKRQGCISVLEGDVSVRGMFYDVFQGKPIFLAVFGNRLYYGTDGFEGMISAQGEVPGEGRVSFFPFHDGLYLLTGNGIRAFRDSAVVLPEPYVPTVMISTEPEGNGVLYEEINLLTNRILQRFSPRKDALKFYPALKNIRSVEWVKYRGETLESDLYYWDEAYGCVEFAQSFPDGVDTLEIQFELDREDASRRIHQCRFAVGFGGANDTRVFLYGNSETPDVRYHSGVVNGKPCFGYFPENGYTVIGTGSPITSILRHYDRQLIFTRDAAYYSYLEYMTGENGKLIAAFPTLPLSDDKGNCPAGQALLIENAPCTLNETGLYQWISTNIRDERNAKCISESIAVVLQRERAEEALLFDRKTTSELFLIFGSRAYVYQYRLKLFYRLEWEFSVSGMCEVGTECYFSSGNKIYRIGGETDDGFPIVARWTSPPLDGSDAMRQKNLYSVSLTGKAYQDTTAVLTVKGENADPPRKKRLSFSAGTEFSGKKIRFPMRRVHLICVSFETKGIGDFSLSGMEIQGRITDKKGE